MKMLVISDLHGRTIWREAAIADHDQVIFLGDYTDSRVFDDSTIYENLKAIIQLKSQTPDKFILLIGNHDAQYLHYPHYRCSGFRSNAQPELSAMFREYNHLFQVSYQLGAYLFSHAGVTNKWLAQLLAKAGQEAMSIEPGYDLAGLLNAVHKQPWEMQRILFEVGPKRGGNDVFSGPVWADRSETIVDYLQGFHQIVGHTPTDTFRTIGDAISSITYTDVLQTKTAFYEVIIPD
ncbi:metallophosphoesterase [Spirosoma sp. RP8]|uniref:Metallophosphoesterase n=1 Tax=Spirosoma liriopis TaxID=2937440 RepID=A0ABT0HGR7_9BACT|nr:metallophosphoesterase [Spirosoma liriopis]MCK8490805.1 metallophosphoesterase [Spirosoma liriopis]